MPRDYLTAIVAEVATEDGQGEVTVPLGDAEITVPPIWGWPLSALAALCVGDHESWAEETLTDDAYDAWCAADPTIDECVGFFHAWGVASGQDLEEIGHLAVFLGEYGPQVEADLRRWCNGLDLRDLFRPGGGVSGLTWRGLKAHIDFGLPGESATKTAIRDAIPDEELVKERSGQGGHGPWSHEALLLAMIADLLQHLLYGYSKVHGGKPKDPQPIPRPGIARKRRGLSPEGLAYLQRLRDLHEQDAARHRNTNGGDTH